MSKWGAALTGALVGGAVAVVYVWLFGPAPGTTHDEHYRSRLDDALEQGQRAASETEAQLRNRYAQLRQRKPPAPPPASDAAAG